MVAKHELHSKLWWKSYLISLHITRKLPHYLRKRFHKSFTIRISHPRNWLQWIRESSICCLCSLIGGELASIAGYSMQISSGNKVWTVQLGKTVKLLYHQLAAGIMGLELALHWGTKYLNPLKKKKLNWSLQLNHTFIELENSSLKCLYLLHCVAFTFLDYVGLEFSPFEERRMKWQWLELM